MASTDPFASSLQQQSSSGLLRALLASSKSDHFQGSTLAPTANYSRVLLLQAELQQRMTDNNSFSPLLARHQQQPVSLVAAAGVPRAEERTALPAPAACFSMESPTRMLERSDLEERQPQDYRQEAGQRFLETTETITHDDRKQQASKKSSRAQQEQPPQKSSKTASAQSKLSTRLSSTDQHWDKMFLRLLVYKSLHGDCLVPKLYEVDPMLGKWVHYQRKLHRTLKPERKKRLQEVGFVFCLKKRDSWECMYRQLEDFKSENGHCMVPQNYKENKKLGKWVAIQRFNRRCQTKERLDLLTKIGFVWSANRAMWNTMFQSLVEFQGKNGHCRVPYKFKADPQLANWIRRQKQNKAYLSSECLEKLRNIGVDI